MRTRAIIVVVALAVTFATAEQVGNSLEHLEGKLTRAMDELNGKGTIGIYGDMVSLEKVAENAEPSQESADPLVSKIERFLRTRKVQINLPDDTSTAGLFGRALGQRNIDIELRSLARGTSEGKRRSRKSEFMRGLKESRNPELVTPAFKFLANDSRRI